VPYADPDDRREQWRRWRQGFREWLREQKGTRCDRCGQEFPSERLHFHHRDPVSKLFVLGRPASLGSSRKRAEEEIAKCDRLCGSCHVEAHRELRSAGLLGED